MPARLQKTSVTWPGQNIEGEVWAVTWWPTPTSLKPGLSMFAAMALAVHEALVGRFHQRRPRIALGKILAANGSFGIAGVFGFFQGAAIGQVAVAKLRLGIQDGLAVSPRRIPKGGIEGEGRRRWVPWIAKNLRRGPCLVDQDHQVLFVQAGRRTDG